MISFPISASYFGDMASTHIPDMDYTHLEERAASIRLLLTDVDGVLTDGGVYYGAEGEVMKRFNIRDGMAVERLRNVGVEVGIITGETSPSVERRAEKLKISLLVLGCKDKSGKLSELLLGEDFTEENVAFIGDDVNDLGILARVGLPAAPSDALPQVLNIVDFVSSKPGGHGAFREFAEFIIAAREKSGVTEEAGLGNPSQP